MSFEIIILVVGIFLIIISIRRFNKPEDKALELQKFFADRFEKLTYQIDQRLRENVKATNESKSFLSDRVSSSERTIREVTASLSKLQETTSALKNSTDEISSFQKLLKNPKMRGGFGEVLLNNLLSEMLPADRYKVQYTLSSSGEIADAIVKLQDNRIVAVDAKFPLPNYELYVQETDSDKKKKAASALVRDVKKHVQDISKKYISPADHTLDYAFMYIPMEGVYYETIIKNLGNLAEFCLQHKVIPVSPNSIFAYLQTILVGLRGMKIEEQTKEILQHLSQVQKDFHRFSEEFTVVGTHLNNAKNRYDDSARQLDKFSNRLEQVETGENSVEVLPDNKNAS